MGAIRYPIRAVSKLTGIPVDTLRAWERRYRAVEPARDGRGRMYSESDVERLRLLRSAVGAGHAIGRVASLSGQELRSLVHAVAPGAFGAADLGPLVETIERFDDGEFRRQLSRLAALLPHRTFCREVALPLLSRVGEAWHAGEIGVAQEHMVSAEIRSLLGAVARSHEARDGASRLVFATPPGELHELGTFAAAIVAADAGLAPLFLGPSVPAPDVVAAAARVRADAVVIGWTGIQSHREPALEAITEIGRDLPPPVDLWVGGAGAAEAARATAGRAIAIDGFDGLERALARLPTR